MRIEDLVAGDLLMDRDFHRLTYLVEPGRQLAFMANGEVKWRGDTNDIVWEHMVFGTDLFQAYGPEVDGD